MGLGDEIMGTGMARQLFAANGVKVAFGDGHQIVWSSDSEMIYKNNPKVARPGEERGHVQWCKHYRGKRAYGRFENGHLVFDQTFRALRGEFFFTEEELAFGLLHGNANRVLIEPRIKQSKVNKQWSPRRFWLVADALAQAGYDVAQFAYSDKGIPFHPAIKLIPTPTIRHAAVALAQSRMFIGPEGGLHHAAAAVGCTAVVIFGGMIHPNTTGYGMHVNIFAGGKACGAVSACAHCAAAMEAITVEQVLNATGLLQNKVATKENVDETSRRFLVA